MFIKNTWGLIGQMNWIGAIAVNFLSLSFSHAEISYLDLKGIHGEIKPEFQAQLSPVFGYTLLGTGALENRRFYGNYGVSSRGYFCSQTNPKVGSVPQLLKVNRDCPLDATSELIQRLFPSQDGVNFVANQVPSDPISHLKPETIGKILEKISKVQDSELNDPRQSTELIEDIKLLLFQDINPKGYKGYLSKQKQDLVSKLNSCKREQKLGIEEKIRAIEEVVGVGRDDETRSHASSEDSDESESSVNSGNSRSQSREAVAQVRGKEKDFQAIAEIIVLALKESRLPPQDYPKYLPEQALMAFFLKKANHKDDMISLFKGMPGALNHPEILVKGSSKQLDFLSARFEPSEYNPAHLGSNATQTARDLVSHPDQLIFSVMQDKLATKALPPILSYGSAKHSALEGGSYPDCGETSLRNFFNIVTYDQRNGKFNADHLTSLKTPGISIHQKLISFYGTHPNPGEAKNQQVYDAWSEEVASKHEGVRYLKGTPQQCEINSGMDNMMTVIDRLLYHGAVGGGPIATAPSRSAKLDKLCEALSREGFRLKWNKKDQSKIDSNDTGVEVEFSINEKPSFKWEFMGGHFAIQDLTKKTDSWKEAVGEELAKSTDYDHHGFLPWFSNEKVLGHLRAGSPSHLRQNLIYSLPLSTYDGRLSGFKSIVSSSRDQAIAMKPLADRLRSKLPEETDHQMKQEIYAALADAGNPYEGDTIHALNKPDAVYRRVSPQELERRFGLKAAQQMGRSWERVMHGHPLFIGEPLMDSNGTERELNFVDAKKACLDLNLPTERAQVESAFREREEKLEPLRSQHESKLKQGERDALNDGEQREYDAILSSHKIPGCYLPSREEWKVLESDFGKQENKYIPQILPKLKNRRFWSSSRYPYDFISAFVFNRYNGFVDFGPRSLQSSVRCACGEAVEKSD
jgi:hypothetical protein